MRRHDLIVRKTFYLYRAAEPVKHHFYQSWFIVIYPFRLRQGRETISVPFTIILVAGGAIRAVYGRFRRHTLEKVVFDLIRRPDIRGRHLTFFHSFQLRGSKSLSIALVRDTPDLSFFRIANVQGTIGPFGHTHRTIHGIA